MFIKHKILSIEIPDIPQLFVATCYVPMTTTIAQKSRFFLHKHRFVLQRVFPVVLQPHHVKPSPSHNETLLTACLKEVRVYCLYIRCPKILLSDSSN